MNKQESHELSRKDTIDVVVYKRRMTHKERAAENLRLDPTTYQQRGRKGGKVSGIKKGFSATDPERVKEIQAQALAARRAQRETK